MNAQDPAAVADMREFWRKSGEWQQKTFAGQSAIGSLRHLAKEAVEAQHEPFDLTEFADCLFLIFDSTRRAGFTYDQLLDAAWAKLAINQAREWQSPGTTDDPVEHKREAEIGG